jgi:hypothetical protein
MFERRLYRAAFLPLLPAVIIAAFSLTNRPAPLSSNLSPNAFGGAPATQQLAYMVQHFPDRRPGSPGDNALAAYVADQFRAASNTASGTASSSAAPFSVQTRSVRAQTIDGPRTILTVIATRPENLNGQIVLLAHRDSAHRGAAAQLSGTAALLELARVLAGRLTNRTITLVSTSGGSGGDAGAIDFAEHTGGPVQAVIVLGDVAGRTAHTPIVIPWSDGVGSAPDQLVRTVNSALAGELAIGAGEAGAASQYAHLALPFAIGEQGPLNAAGLPAVLVQVSGERGPGGEELVSMQRMQNVGRAVLQSVNALDADPNDAGDPVASIQLKAKSVPAWAVRLLAIALLLPPLLVTVDALARARRRRAPVGHALAWALSCALPFFFCALLTVALGSAGLLRASPASPVFAPDVALGGGRGIGALVLLGLAFVLAWLARGALLRTLGTLPRGDEEADAAPDLAGSGAAGVALMLMLVAVALVIWVLDPFTVLLLVPAAHLWLLIAAPELQLRRSVCALMLLAGLLPVAAVIGLYAHELGLSPPETAWTLVLLVAGGHIGLVSSALWSACLACLVAAGLLGLRRAADVDDESSVTVRGPLSYAGPGSLGGTESALRR